MKHPSGPHRAALGTLPPELFDIVIDHISDDIRSLKRLRLSGIALAHDELILQHLFRRVSLSLLKSSVHSFTSIAARPHLARHVRVLVWQELPPRAGYPGMFDEDIAAASSRRDSRKLAELFRQREEVLDRVADACWVRVVDDSIVRHRAYHWAVSEYFWSWFSPALANMPQAKRLVIEAVPPSTRIRGVFDPRCGGGGKRPVTIKMLHETQDSGRATRRVGKREPGQEQVSSTLCNHIRMALQEHVCRGLLHDGEQQRTRPKALASVWGDQTGRAYTYSSFTYGPVSRDLWHNVSRLTLKIDSIDVDTMRDVCDALSAAQGLRRLNLVSEVPPKGIAVDVGSVFLEHVTKPDNLIFDLEYLRLENCYFTIGQLVRFIRAHHPEMLERVMLQDCFLQLTAGSAEQQEEDDLRDLDGLESVETAIRTILCELPPEAAAWSVLFTHDIRLPMTLERAYLWACVALADDDDRSDGTAVEQQRRRPVAVGAHVSLFVKPYRFSAEAFTHRWMWGRQEGDEEETVYYWRADGSLSEPTSMWKFTHGASGETKYGNDPRVFWPDWDEDREGGGDVAVPTPFCHNFRKFVHKSRWTGRYDPAHKVPEEGAVEFDKGVEDELVRLKVW